LLSAAIRLVCHIRFDATSPNAQKDIASPAIITVDDATTPDNDVIVDELLSVFELSTSLRDQVMCACRSLSSDEAKDVIVIMRTVIDAHMSTCLYTADKVAIGLIKYEASVASKPTVSGISLLHFSLLLYLRAGTVIPVCVRGNGLSAFYLLSFLVVVVNTYVAVAQRQ